MAASRAKADDVQDPLFLSTLMQVFASRQHQCVSLSNLGQLLPADVRNSLKKGGLKSKLQQYPDVFRVAGRPGEENVALAARSLDPEVAQPREDDDDGEESAVQLRGLPYQATIFDIQAFLGKHVESLRKEPTPIQIVHKRDGRASGFARVNFESRAAAEAARDELHKSVIRISAPAGSAAPKKAAVSAPAASTGDRYVEIFLFSERKNKLRFGKAFSASAPHLDDADRASLSAENEQVLSEVRAAISKPGKAEILLSMLGAVLSDEARRHLERTGEGVKNFLAQYPHEFSVSGQRGQESVCFLPAVPDDAKAAGNSDMTKDRSEPVAVAGQTDAKASGSRRAIFTGAAAGLVLVGGTGGVAGGAVGLVSGAAAGVPLAFFTFGLSVPLGALLGCGAGVCAGTAAGGSAGVIGGAAAGYGCNAAIKRMVA